MEANAILCNHAEVAEGKLYVTGGAITMLTVNNPVPPFQVTTGLAVVVTVPYTATNQPHKLEIELIDHDENPVQPYAPEGAPANPPLRVEAGFNLGRGPLLQPGEAQLVPFAINFPGLPLAEMGNYSFKVSLDQTEVQRVAFRLVQTVQQLGMGPTAIR